MWHPDKRRWEFFFVGHVSNPHNLAVKIGVHAAAPLAEGSSAAFSFLKVQRCPKVRSPGTKRKSGLLGNLYQEGGCFALSCTRKVVVSCSVVPGRGCLVVSCTRKVVP